uniref:receptor protein serine/threonine kinase n=1 Tax=Crocodylus porosus TaxID=8502 RepID=A0A7M4EHE3_CROPO
GLGTLGRRRLGGLSTQDPAQPRVSAGVLGRSCIFYEHPSVRGSLRHQGRTLRGTKPGAVQCLNSECCFGLWNQSHILMQGCWSSDRDGCEAVACVPSPRANVLRCLCRADLCNANISTLGATPRGTYPPHPRAELEDPLSSAPSGPLWIAGVVLLFLGCLALLGTPRPSKWGASPALVVGAGGGTMLLWALGGLCPQVLQTGRFSVVWRGSLRGVPVVIKAFPAASAQHFAAEWGVLSRPLMNHENLVQLLEARRGDGPSRRGGLLVMPLYAQGSLRYFLSQHASPWEGTLRLALSLACGLAFLHDELWHDGLYKPSVAHRDLSSQNVLVRDDGACAITDFGLAMVLPTSPEAWPRGRSPTAIRKLGTQRYMAPEILDESLDLRRWGCALKQADIYAFALVLWEILTRCPALFPGEGPGFKPPTCTRVQAPEETGDTGETEAGGGRHQGKLRHQRNSTHTHPLLPQPGGCSQDQWGEYRAGGAGARWEPLSALSWGQGALPSLGVIMPPLLRAPGA